MKTEKFHWAVVGHQDRLFEWTISWQRKGAISKAIDNMPLNWGPPSWKLARKKGWRVIKVSIVEYVP